MTTPSSPGPDRLDEALTSGASPGAVIALAIAAQRGRDLPGLRTVLETHLGPAVAHPADRLDLLGPDRALVARPVTWGEAGRHTPPCETHGGQACTPDHPCPSCTPLRSTSGGLLGVLRLGHPIPADPRRARLTADVLAAALERLQLDRAHDRACLRDAETGLYQRRFAEETLRRELAHVRRQASVVSLFRLEVPSDTPPTLHRLVALVLESHSRGHDVVARWDALGFAVVLPGMHPEQVTRRAEQILAHLEAARPDLVGVRAAIAAAPHHGEDVPELVAASDRALAEAHASGPEVRLHFGVARPTDSAG